MTFAVKQALNLTNPRLMFMLEEFSLAINAAVAFLPFRDCLLTSGKLMASSHKSVAMCFLVFVNAVANVFGRRSACNNIFDTPNVLQMDAIGGL
jgi:hypothetical protein